MGMFLGTTAGTAVTISGAVTANPSPTKLGTGQVFKSFTLQGTTINSGATRDLYSVTAGKTFYLTSANFINTSGGDPCISLRDGAGGADMFSAEIPALTTTVNVSNHTFPVPIPFASKVTGSGSLANGTYTISGQGYEE